MRFANAHISKSRCGAPGKKTTVIFMGDIWKQKTLWDSRYLWMPVEIGDGTLRLPEPKPWKINLKTGETELVP